MPRRVSVPPGDDLFRPTVKKTAPKTSKTAKSAASAASGRVKHDEKMTVYLTAEELMALEHARLELKSLLGRNIDRGRVVRAALDIALDQFERTGNKSELARRLRDL